MSTANYSFTINGVQYTVDPTISPETSLNTYLREYVGLKGTKFMCREGGCGACIVTIKFQQPFTLVNTTCAVNSCLYPLYSCDNTEITTIEGLGNKQIGYSVEQKALGNFHGSQCGYCSPGMVMNMHSLMMSKPNLTKLEIENSFGGNICRCTGYRPILDAFKSLVANVESPCARDIEDMPKKCHKTGLSCGGTCKPKKIKILSAGNIEWHKAFTIADIFQIFNSIDSRPYILLSGNTAHGVYRRDPNIEVFIDVTSVTELHYWNIGAKTIQIGGNVSLNETIDILKKAANLSSSFEYCRELATHIDKIANVPVRNVGTLAGNLSIKYSHREFPSDLFLILETIGAQLTIEKSDTTTTIVTPSNYLKLDMTKCLITLITLNSLPIENYSLKTYKIMPRAQNAHAFVNAGFLYKFNTTKTSIISATICYGGINPTFIHASGTESYLIGKNLFSNTVIQGALNALNTEISPDSVLPDKSPEFRKNLTLSLFYKSVLALCPTTQVTSKYKSGGILLERPLSSGIQAYDTYPNKYPVTQDIKKIEAEIQCSGEAIYVNDIPKQPFELWAAFVLAEQVFDYIVGFDATEALAMPGVFSFLTAHNIPGTNTFAPALSAFIVTNEEIFCSGLVLFNGQPAGMILADSFDLAHKAAETVKILYAFAAETKQKSYKTMQEVLDNNITERIVRIPNMVRKDPIKHELNIEVVDKIDDEKESSELGGLVNLIADRMILESQYHYHMETQSCVCIPINDRLEVHAATQWIDLIQNAIAISCLIPLNKIDMTVARVGGAFGGKVSRASQIACACALGALQTNRPVRFQMQMEQNMRAIGKRSSCIGDYMVTCDFLGKILTLTNTFYEDSGCSINEPNQIAAVLGFTNCYDGGLWVQIPNAVLTDSPSNTWIRAPGTLEAVCMIENIMEHIAKVTGKSQYDVRLKNISIQHPMYKMLKDFVISSEFDTRKATIDSFNLINRWRKRGIALVPLNYGLVFIGIFPVKLQVYSDGTVAITHGGIEMGQGINTKAVQCAAYTLGIPLNQITILPSHNKTVPNASASGGSITSDSVCYAVIKACQSLNSKIQPTRNSMTNPTWAALIAACSTAGIDLSASYTYTPMDSLGKSYAVYGVCCTEVEIDLLTGNLILTRVDILEDVGNSMNPGVDVGQIEGAFVMGLGYMLMEELITDKITGRLLTDRSWNYKPPGAKDIPVDFRITFLRNSTNSVGVMGSKATGEPAIAMACCAIFALRHALTSARKDAGLSDEWFRLSVPSTTESIVMASGNNFNQFKI